jgi:hypothetical protein
MACYGDSFIFTFLLTKIVLILLKSSKSTTMTLINDEAVGSLFQAQHGKSQLMTKGRCAM